MTSVDPTVLDNYENFPHIEEAFRAALDESLAPRDPDYLYDVVRALGLPPGSAALDLGCGEGRHSFELAGRFGFAVQGIDPISWHIEACNERLAGEQDGTLRDRMRFELGAAEQIPLPDSRVELI